MTNTCIQNSINLKRKPAISVAQNSAFGDKKADNVKSNIKPERPAGYIVKENPIELAGSSVLGLAKTYKYFINAANGEGTDYTVGRVNDGGKFLGSLGIAAALAAIAKNPKAKVMEFVGFATWFSSMALWPYAVGAGVKAVKGVDINQEYIDSYGRRKRFYEDSQYITWDLYKDKDLYKMGDKLGVPKNIENRKEAIQEKAKQVSIQGNTLMMLTAGFATPVVTALICNSLESPTSKTIETVQNLKAQHSLKKLNNEELICCPKKDLIRLADIVGPEQKVRIDKERAKQIMDLFDETFKGTGIGDGINKEVKNIIGERKFISKVDESVIKALYASLTLDDETLKAVLGKNVEHIEAVKKAIKPMNEKRFEKMLRKVGPLNKNGRDNLKSKIRETIAPRLRSVGKLHQDTRSQIHGAIMKQINSQFKKHCKFEVNTEHLINLYRFGHDFVARINAADDYLKATIGNIADSKTANNWENAPRKIVDALGMDKHTRKLIVNDPMRAPEYIEAHLRELAKDEKKLNKAVSKITKIAEKVVIGEEIAAYGEDGKGGLIKIWNDIKKSTDKNLDNLFKNVPEEKMQRKEIFAGVLNNAIRIEKTKVDNKIINTKSSFYKPLLVLERIKDNAPKEVVRELITGFGIDFWSNKGEHLGIKNSKGLENFINRAFAPIEKIFNNAKELDNKAKKDLPIKLTKFYGEIKAPLSHIDGANRNFIGNSTKNRSDWAIRVGKSLNDFVRDAATSQSIKNIWQKRVLYVAAPLVAVSLLAISMFGYKNEYNPDIYQIKKK